jgi:hypothetical protein
MKITAALLACLVAALSCFSQSAIRQKLFMADVFDLTATVPFHEPGGPPTDPVPLVSFSAQVGTPGKYDVALVRIDSTGTALNTRLLYKNPSFHDWVTGCIRLNGFYWATGSSRAFDTSAFSHESSFLLKLDDSLNLLAQTNFFLPGRELFAGAITGEPGGGLILSGSVQYNTAWSFFLMKTDTAGSVQWFRQYAQPVDVAAVRVLANGDILVSGSAAYGFQFIQPVAMRFDASGNLLWAKNYLFATGPFDNQNSVLSFIHEFGNGRLWLAGRTDYSGAASLGWMDAHVLMADPNGDVIWSRTYGGSQPDWPYGFDFSPAGHLVVSGSTGSLFNFSNFGFLQFIDTAGTLVASLAFGDTSAQEQIVLSGFRPLNSTGALATGLKLHNGLFALYVSDYTAGTSGSCPVHSVAFQWFDASSYPVQAFFFSADSSLAPTTNNDTFNSYSGLADTILCNSPTAVQEPAVPTEPFVQFPNPVATDRFTVTGSGRPSEIILYSATGRVVGHWAQPSGPVRLRAPANGVYFLKIAWGSFAKTYKLAVAK